MHVLTITKKKKSSHRQLHPIQPSLWQPTVPNILSNSPITVNYTLHSQVFNNQQCQLSCPIHQTVTVNYTLHSQVFDNQQCHTLHSQVFDNQQCHTLHRQVFDNQQSQISCCPFHPGIVNLYWDNKYSDSDPYPGNNDQVNTISASSQAIMTR